MNSIAVCTKCQKVVWPHEIADLDVECDSDKLRLMGVTYQPGRHSALCVVCNSNEYVHGYHRARQGGSTAHRPQPPRTTPPPELR